MCKKLRSDHSKNWYFYKLESVIKNDTVILVYDNVNKSLNIQKLYIVLVMKTFDIYCKEDPDIQRWDI